MKPDSQAKSVVIVGAGIVGIACAHYLSKAGLHVTVIDRKNIAGACSHANCGYICPSHILPLTEPGAIRVALKSLFNRRAPFRIKPRLSPSLWNWMWQFSRRCTHRRMLESAEHLKSILDSSIVEYRRIVAEEHFACEWKDSGLLYVLQTARGMEDFGKTDQILSDHFGVRARHIPGTELPSFDPALKQGLAGAFYYADDASLRPDLLASEWSSRLRDRGVTFVEDCELLTIGKSKGRITCLSTSTGEMPVDRVVFAAGAWSVQLSKQLGCAIPIEPGKGYSVTMTRPDPSPTYPMLFPEHKVGMTPFENGYRLGSMMEFAGFDATIPRHRIAQLRESARPYLVTPFTNETQQTWYGWRPMTWDSLPIIGAVPSCMNAYLATGHNMLGLSLAPATGKLIAEMLCETPTHIDAAAFSPRRFQ